MKERFSLETAVARAARHVGPEQLSEFRRLLRTLVYGPDFQFVFCECTDQLLRDRLIAQIDDVLRGLKQSVTTVRLDSDSPADHLALEEALTQASESHEVVHVLGLSSWWTADRIAGLNVRREAIAQKARSRLVFWFSEEALGRLITGAPDLWSWRTASAYAFDANAVSAPKDLRPIPNGDIDNRSLDVRRRRISELSEWTKDRSVDEELKASLLAELAELLANAGDMEEALRIREDELLPFYKRIGDAGSFASTMLDIADIHRDRGEFAIAMGLYRERVLPLFEDTDDLGLRAATMNRIAAILEEQGEFDEAIRILREEVLPAYERSENSRAQAITTSQIASLNRRRGDDRDALRIYLKEVLPVFDRIGDIRGRAATLANIADVYRTRGELNEALRIYQEDVLPIFVRLGDVRGRAITMGDIAHVLQLRGEYDSALNIVLEEQLPAFETLGATRELIVARGNAAVALMKRNRPKDKYDAKKLLEQALADARKIGLSHDEKEIKERLKKLAKTRY